MFPKTKKATTKQINKPIKNIQRHRYINAKFAIAHTSGHPKKGKKKYTSCEPTNMNWTRLAKRTPSGLIF